MTHFIMLVGIPGSGKSTLAKSLSRQYNATIHASDVIRNELHGSETAQDNHTLVFETLHKRVKEDLAKGQSTIYDATNISYKRRMAFLQEIKKYNAYTICYVTIRSYEGCIAVNDERERVVPHHSIKNMIKSFWVPQYYEGWNEIKLVYNEMAPSSHLTLEATLNSLKHYNQKTRWHSLTLGHHLTKTQTMLYSSGRINLASSAEDKCLHIAALYHDIGKPFVKTFTNKKGEPSKDAHYYGHANASAYEFLVKANGETLLSQKSILAICNYIQWHMLPYNILRNGGGDNFINLVGKETYKRLMLLNEADRKAH